MANNFFQLNYDESVTIAKNFKDEGEDIARLHSKTRQRVQDLYKEWIGEGADKFFEEMETILLPALQRLSLALFHTQDITNQIMKIIQNADEETASYFKDQVVGDDFGTRKFGDALNGLGRGQGSDDFGAGKFGDALGVQTGGGSSSDDFGASKFGDAAGGNNANSNDVNAGQHHDQNSAQGGGHDHSNQNQKDQKQKDSPPQTNTKSTSGGGGGSSQGLKGSLKDMGAGLGSVTPQNAESGGGGGAGISTPMPDHLYSDDGSSNSGGSGLQTNSGGGSSSAGQSASGCGAAAAGVAGAGAAAAGGGAAKVLRGKKKKDSGE